MAPRTTVLTFDEICELVRLVGETGVAAVEIEHSGDRLRIDGRPPEALASAVVHPPVTIAQPTAQDQGPSTAAEVGPVEPDADDDLHIVTSPIVGTFYRAPNPDAAPYVAVGDFVEKGQSLCIVEAMKLMNEIEADVSGVVARVFPDNAEPVEFGERLFAIRAS
jgi:acetyl-CoA carboxylase biotin carboxyl carrier protein